jgi:hypothetical protein
MKTPGQLVAKSDNGICLYTADIGGSNREVSLNEVGINVKPFGFGERPLYNPGDVYRVLLVFPTEKDEKIKPLREWAYRHINEWDTGNRVEFGEARFDVNDTGVGSQPYSPKGFQGAWNRVSYCAERVDPTGYHAILILSMESDFSNRIHGYDKPNFIAYECYSQYTLAGQGCGPYGQRDLLEIACEAGFIDPKTKLCGCRTYGDVMNKLFGLKSSDWQGAVAVSGKSRARFFGDLLDVLKLDVEAAFGH